MKLHYFGGFFLLVLISSVLLYLTREYVRPEWIHPLWWVEQLYFIAIGVIAHIINKFGMKNYKDSLHLFYMGSLTIRLLTGLIFITVLLVNVATQRPALAFEFLGLYLLYSWFEIYFLLRNLRANLKKSDGSN